MYFWIAFNNIKDEGFRIICSALKFTKVNYLYFCKNSLGKCGMEILGAFYLSNLIRFSKSVLVIIIGSIIRWKSNFRRRC